MTIRKIRLNPDRQTESNTVWKDGQKDMWHSQNICANILYKSSIRRQPILTSLLVRGGCHLIRQQDLWQVSKKPAMQRQPFAQRTKWADVPRYREEARKRGFEIPVALRERSGVMRRTYTEVGLRYREEARKRGFEQEHFYIDLSGDSNDQFYTWRTG